MTGPQHYKAAEKLLAMTEDPANPMPPEACAIFIAKAQAHATLAQAAATAHAAHLAGYGGK